MITANLKNWLSDCTRFCRQLAIPLIFLAAVGSPSLSRAESVDSELLLLVDVSKSGMKNGDFDSLMSGYAEAFTNSAVIDSIASGQRGKIAVSLMFFGVDAGASVGIPWMSIGSLSEAQAFAGQLTSLARPSSGNFEYADAIAAGVASMGPETGGSVGNGYESLYQTVEVFGMDTPGGSTADNQAASEAALAAGVDSIGAIVSGKKAAKAESYYASTIVGGAIDGVPTGVVNAGSGLALPQALSSQLAANVSGAATVPEPSSALMLVSSMGALLLVRRRQSTR